MTIIQLEYLLAVANCGNFSKASELCFVTQPSLSMQIKNLEEELGVILLDRSKKPVVPTQVGALVIEKAKEALLAYNNVRECVAELKGNVAGKLRLGVIPTIAPYLLPRFVHTFGEKYPKVDLEIREMTTSEIIRAMDSDEIDAALLAGGTCPDRISEQELFDDRFYAYVSPENPLSARSNLRIEDIYSKDLILLAEGHCLRDQVIELCGHHRLSELPYTLRSGSLETVMRIVDATAMLTIIPEMALPYIPENLRNRVKTLAKGAASRKIVVGVRRTYAKETIITALRETIIECVTKRPGGVARGW
ncbi:MAG: hydrogen peroxide-inducible genes activator [Tidjanibacter sp.]|nr:hydrogen peroxide-inducible genes activator [Tidjanibacter sp.]